MKNPTQQEIDEIIDEHRLWVESYAKDGKQADFSGMDLTGAYLTYANLSGANLTKADLSKIKEDFISKLELQPDEIPYLLNAIQQGNVNGAVYEGDCACFVGTIAKAAGVNYRRLKNLKPDESSPTEIFFLGIDKGDTPDTNPISKIVEQWILEWIKRDEKDFTARD